MVISLIIPKAGGNVLTASARGYGKQTPVEDFPCKGRGNQGVIGMQCTERNGYLAGAVQVFEGDDVMLISDQGTMVRTRTSEISVLGRNTQGVTLIKVANDENLVSLARIEEPEDTAEVDADVVTAESPEASPEEGGAQVADAEAVDDAESAGDDE